MSCCFLACAVGVANQKKSAFAYSIAPRLLCRGEGKRAWHTLFGHVPSSLVNLHSTLLHLWSMSVYLLKGCTAAEIYTLCETHTCMGDSEVRNSIALTVTVCIASFKVISGLQRKDCVSCVLKHLAGMD